MSEVQALAGRLGDVEAQITTHEAVCAVRYEGIEKATKEMKESIAKINSGLFKVGVMLMAGMAGILVKLVFFPA